MPCIFLPLAEGGSLADCCRKGWLYSMPSMRMYTPFLDFTCAGWFEWRCHLEWW